jgi:pentatricopeptide repeat protein
MIDALFRSGRKKDAIDLFAAISANCFVPNVVTYTAVMVNLIKEGLLEESDNLILAMEKTGCAPKSKLTYAQCCC